MHFFTLVSWVLSRMKFVVIWRSKELCKDGRGIQSEEKVSFSHLYSELRSATLEARLVDLPMMARTHKRNNGWIKYLTLPEAAGKLGRGEPRKLWKETVTEEFQFWKVDADNLYDRPKWKKSLKIAMKCPILGNQGLLFHNGRYWTING